MKAIVSFEIEIDDNNFDSDEQKQLFYEAPAEQQKIWLENTAREMVENSFDDFNMILTHFEV